jgi:hypothetical protein
MIKIEYLNKMETPKDTWGDTPYYYITSSYYSFNSYVIVVGHGPLVMRYV